MSKLNDTQLVLLSAAAQRESGSLYPLPESLAGAAARAEKAVSALLRAALIEEGEVEDTACAWRQAGEQRFGVRINHAGKVALGLEEPSGDDQMPVAASPARSSNKTGLVLDLLRRADGATLAEIMAATNWLPHSTRAALTGLRKKAHRIERTKRGEETCYRIVAEA